MNSMLAFVLVMGILYGLIFGYGLGVKYPSCTPGAQRGCNVKSGDLGVEYCTESGFGWEPCQGFDRPDYPQAKWRTE